MPAILIISLLHSCPVQNLLTYSFSLSFFFLGQIKIQFWSLVVLPRLSEDILQLTLALIFFS